MDVLSATASDLRPPSWRRSMTWSAMTEVLGAFRAQLGFENAILLRLFTDGHTEVLGANFEGGELFQYGEPVTLSDPAPGGLWQGAPLQVTSALTGTVMRMDRAVSLPLKSQRLHCLLLLGNGDVAPAAASGDILALRIGNMIRRNDRMRHRDAESAYRMVAEAAAAFDDPTRTWGVVLACARRLLASDTAYVAVPVTDSEFAFAQTLGVRTKEFRDLRVGPGQGLGSVANEQRTLARSINYAADPRFSTGMRETTSTEGIYSALACPIIIADNVDALLYVAHHGPLAYNCEDEAILADYAAAARLALTSSYLEDQRRRAIRRDECDRLAAILHDRLGRQLTRLSFAAADLAAQTQPENAQQINALSETIQDCIDTVRREISTLGAHDEPAQMSLRDLANEICTVPTLSGISRVAIVEAAASERTVPTRIAEVLIRVGQEAVFNAEVHSAGSRCAVWLGEVDGNYLLEVEDDGIGLDEDRRGHGLTFASRLAELAGGSLSTTNRPDKGVRVRCVIPAPVPNSVSQE